MDVFLKYAFVLLLFSPCDASASLGNVAKKLTTKTLKKRPTKQNMDRLDGDIRSLVEEIYHNNRGEFRNGATPDVIGNLIDDSSIGDLNFKAALYSIAIRSLASGRSPREPYFYLTGEFTFALRKESPDKISEATRIMSSSYFRLPSIEDDVIGYRQIIFEYVGRNFDRIHENGGSKKIIFKWWRYEDFRDAVFDSIQKEHLDEPEVFLKWWREDKKRGTGRFENLAFPYFRRLQNEEAIHDDPFWDAVLEATRKSDSFDREISSIFDQLKTEPIEDMSPLMIRALDSERIGAIKLEELQNLNPEQVEAFSDHLDKLNPRQRRALWRVHRYD